MRLSRLASVVLAPVLVALLATRAHAAAPASSGLKRVAKRAPVAALALPAPAPKEEPLPQLPPPPPSWSSFTPPAPVSLEAQPSPVVDAVASPDVATKATRDVKPKGWVLQLGTGVLAPTSSFVPGTSTVGPGISFDVRLGGYVTPHVGLLVGFRGSYAHKSGDCDSCKNGYSLQVPVMLQLAHKDRATGFYGEIGLGFGTTYGGAGDGYTYTLSTPVEVKLGMGYRISGADGTRRPLTLDINCGMDIGKVSHAKVSTGTASYDGAVDNATTHAVVALSLLSHFSL